MARNRAYAIILSGTPSSGKRSTAEALHSLDDSILRIVGDDVISSTAKRLIGERKVVSKAEATKIAGAPLTSYSTRLNDC